MVLQKLANNNDCRKLGLIISSNGN